MHETIERPFIGVTLRDVHIKTILAVPDNNDEVETILRLQSPADRSNWHFFGVELLTERVWKVHCEGRISATYGLLIARKNPVNASVLTQRVSGKRWYDAFDRVGFYHGKTFHQLQSVRTDRSVHHATGNFNVIDSSGVMEGESRYIIHPSTIDACLRLIIV